MKLNGIYYFNEHLTFPPFAGLEGEEVRGSYSKILHKENVSFISNGTIYNSFEIVAAVPEIIFNQETIPSYDGMWCKHDIWKDDPNGRLGFFVWNDEAYRTIIFYNQTVSDTFYTWFMNNAKEVQGIYSIKKSTLKGIADSIREKKGTSENILVSDFANEIGSIETGITPSGTIEVTENGTHDVTEYANVAVNVEDASKSDLISLIDRSITHIDIPEGISAIGAHAFAHSYKLVSVFIPDSVRLISSQAFFGCKMLFEVNIPNNVTEIASEAFKFCYALEKVTIGSNVKSMAVQAFSGDTTLKTVVCYAETPPTIQANAFLDVPTDCVIYVPYNSVEAYKTATNWSDRAEYIKPICVLNGTYLFNEYVGSAPNGHEENIQFVSSGKNYSGIRLHGFPEIYYDSDFVYSLDGGWLLGEEYRTLTLDNQTVSEEFYTWFMANATEVTE
ncbi:MAG: leucine-rich repeat domain-containing protein [Clostridia bacterium]|nr:leucine-rich repeat domain-containing protein [Clostridia bacterium]